MKVRWSLNIDKKLLENLREIQEEKKFDEPDQPIYRSFNAFLVSLLRKYFNEQKSQKI